MALRSSAARSRIVAASDSLRARMVSRCASRRRSVSSSRRFRSLLAVARIARASSARNAVPSSVAASLGAGSVSSPACSPVDSAVISSGVVSPAVAVDSGGSAGCAIPTAPSGNVPFELKPSAGPLDAMPSASGCWLCSDMAGPRGPRLATSRARRGIRGAPIVRRSSSKGKARSSRRRSLREMRRIYRSPGILQAPLRPGTAGRRSSRDAGPFAADAADAADVVARNCGGTRTWVACSNA